MSEIDTNRKAAEILQAIVERCNELRGKAEDGDDGYLSFTADNWGSNTLTIADYEYGHTHVGVPGGSFEELVDGLHDQLVHGRGLSWCPDTEKQNAAYLNANPEEPKP